jgi:hypothetical protein
MEQERVVEPPDVQQSGNAIPSREEVLASVGLTVEQVDRILRRAAHSYQLSLAGQGQLHSNGWPAGITLIMKGS